MKLEDLMNATDDSELVANYKEALLDDDFKRLVSKLKIKDAKVINYTSKLQTTVKELKNCKRCKGLNACKNAIEGCVFYPHNEEYRIRFDYVACKYKKQALEKEKLAPIFYKEPLSIRNASMSEIDLTDKNRIEVIRWVKKFYKEYQNNQHIKGLYLHGSFGSGKTYILSALLNELSSLGYKCVIMYYPEMILTLKNSLFDDEFKTIMHNLKTCDLLLFDDIGAEVVTEWNRDEILGTILQYRMDSHLPTFFSSNLNINELEANLSSTKRGVDIVKAKRIIERIKQLTDDLEMISENRRNQYMYLQRDEN